MKNFLLPVVLSLGLLAGCQRESAQGDDHDHDQAGAPAHAEAAEPVVGDHGGRSLRQDGYSVELAVAERGRPPRFQAWLYRDGKPLPPSAGHVSVDVERLGGRTESFALTAQPDGSLLADAVVAEPHSFDVTVRAQIDGKALQWTYPSYEGRTTIEPAIADEVGIRVAPVGPGVIADEHEVQGLLTPVEGRVATVMARFPGPIRRLDAKVGDAVTAGRTLASIESNLSLSTYTVASPISGVVLARHASVGGVATEGMSLFEVADLSSLWVDLHIFGADAQHIRPGVPVVVTRMSDGVSAEVELERILPGTATASQSTVARATLRNADGLWRPGSAVKARITVARRPVERRVPLSALQRFRDWDVVFIRIGDRYEIRPLQLGERDGSQVEVLSGIEVGDEIVVEQSYVVKADIEKSGASHDH